ncbi:flagellar hook-associated protein FlgK [Endozoicomonas sp. 4G]|uniref:flagellar hook-associated protein FlgK n=1 Tax=Endozoicomonas sp. 4G TaxID=2872754 RepID=UPI0020786926|nr:flagellar hook-associated protein FlgK [Endozoicomonas sp. 4G]
MSMTQIGISGLQASQASLNVTSNNIANAESEGYSRQRVYWVPSYTLYPGIGTKGTGVNTSSVDRIASSFITAQMWETQSLAAKTASFSEYITSLDQWLGDDSTSLTAGLDSFFTTLNGASADPYSSASRQVILSESNKLAQQFTTLNNQIVGHQDLVGRQLEASVAEVNGLLANIAGFNSQVQKLSASSQASNELLDQRDLAVKELSKLLGVNVMEQPDGRINIFLKSGQPLLLGDQKNSLNVSGSASHPDGFSIEFVSDSAALAVQGDPGGSIGGILSYQNGALRQAQNEIGRLAVVMSSTINAQLRQGEDLNGNTGVDLFSDLTNPASGIFALDAASGAVSDMRIADSSQLKASEYDLRVDNTGNYVVTRLSDGVQVDSGSLSGAAGTQILSFDGVEIDIDGAATDQIYRLSPVRYGARDLDSVLTDPSALALAAAGAGVADNSNLQKILELQNGRLVEGERSLTESYSRFIGDIAVQTSQAKTEADGGKKLFEQVEASRNAYSGVNLDEEAANLMRFQQLYGANAQVISVARQTFDSLLRMF